MKRHEFLSFLGGAAAAPAMLWPQGVRAQQPALPVIAFLRSGSAEGAAHLVAALRQGLREAGLIEGQNVAIEFHWADDRPDRLSALAAGLARRPVSVIIGSASTAALAAKAATSTIPIVFVAAGDPVEHGLVKSLARPGGNATGVSYLTSARAAKRVEFLHDLVPAMTMVAALVHPEQPNQEPFLRDLEAGVRAFGLRRQILNARTERDVDDAFTTLAQQKAQALIVGPDTLFTLHREKIIALAARHALPAIYTTREFAIAGGLMVWGTSLTEQYRLAGTYAGRVLKGAKPADLPVTQPSKFELIINLKTAKALGIDVPEKLLALADEVIE
ncbi:MAG: ABC transporter substrate-binding protein [Xanthobacteraceae bacterium]